MFVSMVPNLKEESMVVEDLNIRLDIGEYYKCKRKSKKITHIMQVCYV